MRKLSEVELLATSEDEEMAYRSLESVDGVRVTGTTVYDGPVPPNSFVDISENMRMSTPEFFLFRKVAENDDFVALFYICEMFGTRVTNLTRPSIGEGEYETITEPRLTMEDLVLYLVPSLGTEWEPLADRLFALASMVDATELVSGYESFVEGRYRLH